MKKENLNNDMPESTPAEKPFSFNDLDLGLDFDLSFLDDIDESVLEEPVPAKKSAASAEAPVKKAAPAKKPAPAATKDGAVKKAAPSSKPSAKNPGSKTGEKAAATKPAGAKTPAKTSAAPAKKQPAPHAEPVKKKKKGPRLGGVIFYTLYFLFILVFFLAAYIGLQFLQSWLIDYEAAQPTVKAEQVFTQLFTDPDWEALYVSAGAQDSAYEGKEEYVAYMEEKVGDSQLTYLEASAGLSGDKKYVVRLGNEKVATFTLTDRNNVGAASLENLENIADIPDWVLGSVEVFFEREGSYLIEKVDGHTVYVNDVALDDSFTIQIATTLAVEEYLPEGTTSGVSTCTQQVTGLMQLPTVKILDKQGNEMEVTYDEATRTFTERTESNTISDEEKERALNAAKTYCLYMIEEADRGDIAKYFDSSSTVYNTITKLGELWMQGNAGHVFENEEVTNYCRYTDDLFSAKVSLNLKVTRKDGTDKDYGYSQTLFFQKNDSGKWMVFDMTNKDVSAPVGKVRLTFMLGDTQLTTDLYQTDLKEIITPILPEQEGKVFTGWVTISKDETGATVYNLEFQPDETGRVVIPEGTTLKPMTLYALFQDAGSVTEPVTVPAETTAEAVETTVPETTEGA